MAKKYYWLKLQEGFFKSLAMKKLRRIAGGDTYTIIYLKLQLLSLQDEGLLYFEGIEKDFAEELALAIDEDVENVKVTLNYLESVGLLVKNNPCEYFLSEVPCLIGKETDKARLMRQKRAKDKQLALENGNNVTALLPPVTFCYTDIDIEKDIDIDIEGEETSTSPTPPKKVKHKYGEFHHVRMTDDEKSRLEKTFGADIVAQYIQKLDEYIENKNAKYKNHSLTIRNWIKKDLANNNQSSGAKKTNQFNNFSQRHNTDFEALEKKMTGGTG